jgi:TonB-linked SusC/RagA family outer membrane protein
MSIKQGFIKLNYQMYKNFTALSRWKSCAKIPIVRMVKLTCILLLVAVLQVSATTYAQRITLSYKNAPLEDVLLNIRSQSGFDFLYSAQLLKKAKPVSVSIKDATLEDVLKTCLEGQPFSYQINQQTVTIVPLPASKQQAFPVRGQVTDSKNSPLPGVSVKVKGVAIGAVTDQNGRYALNLPSGSSVLIFTYIGFETVEQAVNNRAELNVILQESAQSLNDVVVVGYGTQRRSSVTGAVDQINSEAIQGKPAMNTAQALQGVSPNLIVQQSNSEPGAGVNINIRGVGTMGDNNPLYVIDGIVGGDINLLNPSDIQSVSVLKDAGSAAIYGSRSSNGVILVTTKQGSKNAPMRVTLNALAGYQVPHILYKPVKGYENAILRNEANVNAGLTPIYNAEQIRNLQAQGDQEWFLNSILQNALQQNHNVSVSGGTAQSTYLVSAGYADQRNNLVGPDYGLKRYNYRINLNNEYGRFKLSSILSYAKSQIKDHSSSTSTLIVDAGRVPTIYKLQDENGRYLTNDVLAQFNPLGILEQGGYRKYDNDNLFGSLNAEFTATDFLKFRAVVGGTLTANHLYARTMQVDYLPKGVYGSDRNTNDENDKNLFLNTQFIAEFNKTFNESHAVNVLLGISNESATNEGNRLYRRFTDPELGIPTSETVTDEERSLNTNQRTSETSLNSLFGRASYSFNDKYYGQVDFRVDGSSKFSKANRWGFFPAVSGGYRLSQEDFMSDYRSTIGDIKIRGSYGILGNQNVNNYQFQTTYFNIQNAYAFNNAAVSGTGFTFANPDIRWERAATFNIGVDATFFKNSLSVSFDYFDKVTRDILVPPVVPGIFGTTLPDFNSAKMQNRGWELSVNYRVSTGGFRHVIGLNVGDSKNKVLAYDQREKITTTDEMQYIIREGLPYNSYIGLKTDGYFQNIDEVNSGPKPEGLTVVPGDIRYVDVNKDGVINDRDRHVLGNAFPRYTFGLTYAVNFKNFDASIFVQGVGKRNSFIRGEMVEPYHFNYGQVMYQHQLDYWTPVNPDARYPRLAANGSQSNTNNFRRGSDAYLYDAAYARLKNVQIGYSLSDKVAKKIGMQKLRIYASGQNLLTVSKLKFLDPEVTEFSNKLSTDGANSARAYPTPIYYGLGLDVTF